MNPVAAAPVFVARGLTKTYGSGDAQVRALVNVDLEIRRGEFLVLIGASGMADRVIRLGDGRVQSVEINEHKVSPSELSW
jgi:ABC-type dipeptide/oligopeptide/nickel transport system ATPase subunit